MSKDRENMKDAFLTSNKRDMLYMLDYLKETAQITEAYYWNYIGYYVIDVPKEQYEYALKEGRRFACAEHFGIYWVDHYNKRRSPIATVDMAYAFLPDTLIPGEENKKCHNRELWIEDEYTPKTILEYFDSMTNYIKVEKIFREYSVFDKAMTIAPLTQEYEEKMELLKKFVEEYGYGPFETIKPLTYTGELIEEPMYVKKRK